MFFTSDNLAVEPITVAEFFHDSTHNVGARSFSSLSLRLQANTVIYANKNEFRIGDDTLAFIPAQCPYKRVSKNEHMIAIDFRIYNREFEYAEFLRPENIETIRPLFLKILEISKLKYSGYKYDISKYFYMIMKAAAENFNTHTAEENTLKEKISRCVSENYRNADFTVERLADMMHMSEVTLRKHTHMLFDKPPKQLISDMRLNYAKMLINSKEFKIYEISHLSGFSDEKYFGTLFKRKFGTTPAKYGI